MKSLMKRNLLAILFCFLSVSLFAVDFHITVIDSEIEIPLEGVTLTLSDKSAGPWETDFNGECTISLENFTKAVILQAYLPGYAVKKIRLSEDETEITIILSIEEVMEGKELVVEKEAYQTADAESGISVALTKDQIQTTSLIGAIPDVMSTVKTLPGVGYAGAFSQQPSIRGSYPYETAAVLDGMYVLSPYHWSGSVSIFDPLMVESVKLSHGIFSAQYGHSTSALLDVNSVNPVGKSVKINASISSVLTDIYAQIPVTDHFGMVAGFRMSYMNTVPFFMDTFGITKLITYGQIEKLSDYFTMPYMYDYYLKAFYTPSDRLSVSANAFLGLEGLGAQFASETDDDELTIPSEYYRNYYKEYYDDYLTDISAKWDNKFGFGSLNVKWLPIDPLQMVFSGSYNIFKNTIKVDMHIADDSKVSYMLYNWDLEKNMLFHEWRNSSDKFEYEDSYYIQLFQGKTAGNYQIDDLNLISLGFEELYQNKTTTHWLDYASGYSTKSWWDYEQEPEPETDGFGQKESSKLLGNGIANTIGYTYWEFGNDAAPLKGELGLRAEHYFLSREDDRISISTNPYFLPRGSIQWTPVRNNGFIDKLTVSAGAGSFAKMSDDTMGLGLDYSLSKDNIRPDQNVFALLGSQVDFLENMSFQIEAYYKYYINRFYTVATPTDEYDEYGNNINTHKAYADGKGVVAGFDCMLHKKNGRYLDGYLCYSFSFARYLNPTGRIDPNPTDYSQFYVIRTEGGDPLGQWYYPYFHRFHTFNAVINYRPSNAVTITLSGGVASGNPAQVVFQALGEEVYSDNSRNYPVFPVNFRLAFSNYAFATKAKWELYIGVENAFGWLNRNSLLGNMIYNEELDLSNVANFDTGIPTTSVGFKLSF